jgi:hypothetical protein
MFAGIEIDSDLLDPSFWDALLVGAFVLAGGWLAVKYGPTLVARLGSRGAQAVGGASPASGPDAAAVERISVALSEQRKASAPALRKDAPSAGESGAGGRAGTRRKGRPTRVWLRADEEEPFLCWVTDRSRGGLAIVVDRLVPIGTPISVLPADAPADSPWPTLEVRNCRRKGNRWQLGCQFTGEVSSMSRHQLG